MQQPDTKSSGIDLYILWSGAICAALGMSACRQDAEVRPEPVAAPIDTAVVAPPSTPPLLPGSPAIQDEDRAADEGPKRSARPEPKEEPTKGVVPVHVARLVITAAIEGREPVESSAPKIDSSVFAFVEVENASGSAQDIVVTFEPAEGPAVGNVHLPVPAGQKRWRTWAETRHVKQVGAWQAVVRTVQGVELARKPFTVSA